MGSRTTRSSRSGTNSREYHNAASACYWLMEWIRGRDLDGTDHAIVRRHLARSTNTKPNDLIPVARSRIFGNLHVTRGAHRLRGSPPHRVRHPPIGLRARVRVAAGVTTEGTA